MARVKFLLFLLPLVSHLLAFAVSASGGESSDDGLPDILLPSSKQGQGHMKMLRIPAFSFYWHDTSRGSDPTAVLVAQGPTQTDTGFGMVRVMDDPLTIGPDRSSDLIGKSQGIYVSADKETVGLLMVMTFTFTAGNYTGSSLIVVGRNEVKQHVREMPITGGTGLFRFVQGYVQAQTISNDPQSAIRLWSTLATSISHQLLM
ncbi:hypothetical protein KSP40_PGU018260 [Platanthera guangdongensis]|uniref:Dirigent protein n=1 Tax=Platanthera guangdongensis TaxID=2320717 RepID=A0ABR2MH84_9ASPA